MRSFRLKQWMADRSGRAGIGREFRVKGNISGRLKNRLGFTGDLADIYAAGAPQVIHKWHHYLPIYDRYFSPWREKPVRFLEIGVSKGGSLAMWRKYFGPDAIIYGIDIDEACRAHDGIDGQVRIGSQTDTAFLSSVIEEMGGVDIVLDDGSHHMSHIPVTLEHLMPKVAQGGLYMIEDLHTSYWKNWGGGFFSRRNFFNYIRRLIDDQHHWYHVSGKSNPQVSDHITSIHIYDSIVVLEQGVPLRPANSIVRTNPDSAD